MGCATISSPSAACPSPEAPSLLSFEVLHYLSDERRVVLLAEVVDARLRNAEFLHRRDHALPDALAVLALAEVQLVDQLGEALPLKGVLIVVVALDDALLMGGEVFQSHRPPPFPSSPVRRSLVELSDRVKGGLASRATIFPDC